MKGSGLRVFRVQELATHGGSLRVFAQRASSGNRAVEPSVDDLLRRESERHMLTPGFYRGFQEHAERVKDDFLEFLLDAKRAGHAVVGYGAAAKGNTLLNFAGIRPDLISVVVDRNPVKQGKLLPGSRIPIMEEAVLQQIKPNYIVIFPWNLAEEIVEQLAYTREWGAKFVIAVPQLKIA